MNSLCNKGYIEQILVTLYVILFMTLALYELRTKEFHFKSKPLNVGFRYHVVVKCEEVIIEFRVINISRKGRVPCNSSSCLKWILSWKLFKIRFNLLISVFSYIITKVSSTYLRRNSIQQCPTRVGSGQKILTDFEFYIRQIAGLDDIMVLLL